MIDGGLLVLSRFPIIETEFKTYNYGVLSDALSQKGVLYCKIDIHGRILHLFQTHTQATYLDTGVEDFRATLDARIDQLRTIRKFIELKTRNATPNQLIIMAGDMNVNGIPIDKQHHQYRELSKNNVSFNLIY